MDNLPFGFNKPEDSPGFLLWQTTTIWQRQIKKALDRHKISHPQFVIMAVLLWFEANHYNTTQSLIASKTKLDKMTVSKTVRKLVELGLVHRATSKKDTRALSATLSSRGKELIHKLVPIVENIDKLFFNNLTTNECKELQSLLAKLNNDQKPIEKPAKPERILRIRTLY